MRFGHRVAKGEPVERHSWGRPGTAARCHIRGLILLSSVFAVLAGCTLPDNGLQPSDYRNIAARQPPPSAQPAPPEPPIPDLQPVLAAPPPPGLDQRLVSVDVSDPQIPVRDVLAELARKAGVDVDIDPNISGGIIFTAKDRPFAQVVDRICEMTNLRCSFKDSVLKVEIDRMYTKSYSLAVLNAVRKTTMQVATSTDVFSSVQGGGGGGGSNNSTSSVSTDSTADPWTEISDNLKQILTNSNPHNQPITSNVANGAGAATGTASVVPAPATRPATVPGPGGSSPLSLDGSPSGIAPQAIGAQINGAQAVNPSDNGTSATSGGNPVAGAVSAGTASAQAANQIIAQDNAGSVGTGATGVRPAGAAGGSAAAPPVTITAIFTINKSAGIVSVFGTDRQQKLVQAYLTKVLDRASAQVLIEAKVVEVDLKEQYKTGIDWTKVTNLGSNVLTTGAKFATGDQTNFASQALNAATAVPFALSWAGNNITAAINFVQGFGTVRTLSSPRLTVMNNQTAVLKVAQNQVYFQLTATVTPATVAGATPLATYSSTVHTVPIGVVMTVQPSIDPEHNMVTLGLRPTVSVHNGDVADPAVSLDLASACAGNTTGPCSATAQTSAVNSSLVPVVEVREMDSVVTVPSGDLIVMGGLMQQNNQRQSTGVPGAQDIPVAGNLFKAQSTESDVTELVIFLKATVVHGSESADWADRDLYKRYMTDPRPLAF